MSGAFPAREEDMLAGKAPDTPLDSKRRMIRTHSGTHTSEPTCRTCN
jgi:hypothetical protein